LIMCPKARRKSMDYWKARMRLGVPFPMTWDLN